MRVAEWVLAALGAALQFVGVALVFIDISEDRNQARAILGDRGQVKHDLDAAMETITYGAVGPAIQQAAADIIRLREWLSTRLEGGLGRRALGAYLILAGIAVTTAAAMVTLAN
jgi:hypothetical protein